MGEDARSTNRQLREALLPQELSRSAPSCESLMRRTVPSMPAINRSDSLDKGIDITNRRNSSIPDSSSIATSSTRSSAIMGLNRRRLKGLDLGDSSNFWPGARQLRKIFRGFDTDNDGTISPLQFKQGLGHLGFNVSNANALGSLVSELDLKGSGLITQTAFIKAFSKMNRQTLQQKLSLESTYRAQSPDARQPLVSVVDLGLDGQGLGKYSFRDAPLTDLASLLGTQGGKQGGYLRWIDVKGYSHELLELLASILNLPAAILEDVEFAQRAKVEYYPEENVMQVVVHAMSLVNCPIRHNKNWGGVQASKRGREGEPNREFDLAATAAYMAHKPSVESAQIHLIMVDTHTLLTYRNTHGVLELDDLWEDLRPQLQQQMSTLKGAFLFSSISLATEILDEISEHNWQSRDRFKDWKVTLEAAIRSGARNTHLLHVLDMQSSSLVASNVLKGNMFMIRNLTDEAYLENARVKFVRSHLEDFGDVQESFTRLFDQADMTRKLCDQLQDYYKTQQDDRMNRMLYFLTLVTTMIAPVQLFTGIYGMNFDSMPELTYDYAYIIFWCATIAYLIIAFIWFRQRRMSMH